MAQNEGDSENARGPSGQGGTSGQAGSGGKISGGAGVVGFGSGATPGSSGSSGSSGGAGSPGVAGISGTSGAGTGGATGLGGSAGSLGGGGLSAVAVFEDDFESGSDGWTTSGGTWAVIEDTSQVYAQQSDATDGDLFVAAAGDPAWTDQAVEARVKVVSFLDSDTGYFAAIFARYSPANYYDLVLRSSDGKIAIRKNKSTLGNPADVGIQEGVWYTLKLEVVGSTLKGYLDGALVVTATDGTIPSGQIAIGTTVTRANFDDVKVFTR